MMTRYVAAAVHSISTFISLHQLPFVKKTVIDKCVLEPVGFDKRQVEFLCISLVMSNMSLLWQQRVELMGLILAISKKSLA